MNHNRVNMINVDVDPTGYMECSDTGKSVKMCVKNKKRKKKLITQRKLILLKKNIYKEP